VLALFLDAMTLYCITRKLHAWLACLRLRVRLNTFSSSQLIASNGNVKSLCVSTLLVVDMMPSTMYVVGAQQMRLRRSSSLMVNDPYTLIIALDRNLTATGSLYLDDGKLLHLYSSMYVVECYPETVIQRILPDT
jgi:hypothetical protein